MASFLCLACLTQQTKKKKETAFGLLPIIGVI